MRLYLKIFWLKKKKPPWNLEYLFWFFCVCLRVYHFGLVWFAFKNVAGFLIALELVGYAIRDDFEFLTLLHPPPTCWNFRHALPRASGAGDQTLTSSWVMSPLPPYSCSHCHSDKTEDMWCYKMNKGKDISCHRNRIRHNVKEAVGRVGPLHSPQADICSPVELWEVRLGERKREKADKETGRRCKLQLCPYHLQY